MIQVNALTMRIVAVKYKSSRLNKQSTILLSRGRLSTEGEGRLLLMLLSSNLVKSKLFYIAAPRSGLSKLYSRLTYDCLYNWSERQTCTNRTSLGYFKIVPYLSYNVVRLVNANWVNEDDVAGYK
jgi:hypothetical protein